MLREAGQVPEDPAPVVAGVPPVQRGVHELEVVEQHIGVGQELLEREPRALAAGVERGVDAPVLEALEHRVREAGLQGRLAAR